MPEIHEGGCLCGAVRFRVTGPLGRMVQCHCTECQKLGGGAPAYLIGIARANFEPLSGTARGFEVDTASGNPTTRYFCPDCGTPLWSFPTGFPDFAFVKAGAFDRDPGYASQAAVWTSSAPDWHHWPDDLPAFERGSR